MGLRKALCAGCLMSGHFSTAIADLTLGVDCDSLRRGQINHFHWLKTGRYCNDQRMDVFPRFDTQRLALENAKIL